MKSKKIIETPRIEKPYEEIYPHLNINKPLPIVFTPGHTGALPAVSVKIPVIRNGNSNEESELVRYDDRVATKNAELTKLGYSTAFALPKAHYLRNDPIAHPRFPEQVLPGDSKGIPCKHDSLEFVEYDMDEQDLGFLGYLVSQYGVPITAEIFEVTFSMLELESFKIELNMKHKNERMQLIDETQQCVICNEADVDNLNSIVYCDGCDIAVHQECYGVPFIPEGQWLCRRCKAQAPATSISCLFCPHRSGALTKTKEGRWAHVLCGLWIPELSIGNGVYMEPINGTRLIPRDRWRLNCFICQRKQGACIQCAYGDCTTAFHATCGQSAGLSMTLVGGIAGALADPTTLVAFCSRHTPKNAPVHADIALARRALDLEASEAQKEEELDQKRYPEWRTKKGALYVPTIVRDMVTSNIMRRFNIDLTAVMPAICRYWTLKRDDIGAMFSKRLVHALDTSRQESFSAENRAYDLALERERLKEYLDLALRARKSLDGRSRKRHKAT
ncbi:NuA3 HAT complex component NTO1 [Wickerhamiella sorbophila]|uniref:NuA3 HAT complex component NTO1 n=1 Tax=Wickerhamiella sorbophila TaxID=45607 RepID=A0A2T0FFI4_9ASCO|nr:NuA3 HAT complex component NTO1 [Wickerhamiella sorbophila]PRT53748.1 NuA3 HAT complex component NTO1 [Wickerhamiella sorbophila]